MPKPSPALRFALLLVCLAVFAVTPPGRADYKDFKDRRTNAGSFEDSTIFKADEDTNGVQTPHVVVDSGASAVGAAHEANSQVTASTTAGTLIVARPARRSCLVRNTDAAINVYIGGATVTSANGMILKPGEYVVVSAVTLWQVIAASGSPVVAVVDEYD